MNRKRIGVCGVDAGLLMVGDPCYFWPEDNYSSAAVNSIPSWGSFCELVKDQPGKSDGFQLYFKDNHVGLGVVVETTCGDGVYDVFLEEEGGKRRVVIDLD
jgi:hypothetical protein